MLFRAVIICLLASNVWSAGVTIELDTAVTIGTLEYTETDADDNLAPELSPIIPFRIVPLPAAVELPEVASSNQGIIKIDTQNVTLLSSGGPQFSILNDGKLYAHNNNQGQLKSYTFDYDGHVKQFIYPELPISTSYFSIQKTINGSGPEEARAWPWALNILTNTVYEWVENLDEATGQDNAEWNENKDFLDGLDGHLQPAIHSGIMSTGDSVGHVFSYEGGLWHNGWQHNESTHTPDLKAGNVSLINISQSKLIETHRGLAQFYIEAAGPANLRFIEIVGEPVASFETTEPFHNIQSVYNSQGSLYQFHFESGVNFVWHDKTTDQTSSVPVPGGMNYVNHCNETNDRVFCVMNNDVDYILYELINGIFVQDRDLDHLLLEDGLVGVDAIFAHEGERFIAIKTIDLKNRLFNFTRGSAHLSLTSGVTDSSFKVQIIESDVEGSFFYVLSHSGAIFTKRVHTLPPEEEPFQRIIIPDTPAEEVEEVEEEEEEKKEIPFAEMSSSLNLYLLLIGLCLIFNRKIRK